MKKIAALIALLALAGTAHAHSGHGAHGLLSGMAHPLLGWDHLLAMLCVGIWSARQSGRAWSIPLAFSAMLGASFVVASAGLLSLPFEAGIAASVLVLGLLLAGAVRLPLVSAWGLVALCAVFHGLAHGSEVPATVGVAAFGAGMVLSSLVVHVAGFALARGLLSLRHGATITRVLGLATGAAGAVALLA